MALWERLLGDLVLTDDLVLNTVFAGFGIGISLGITIRAGASTGGMDIPPLVLNKWFHLPVSSTMMVFDFIILAAQAAFSPVRQSLYGVVMAIIYTVVLDKVLMLGTTRTEVKIISAKSDEICAASCAAGPRRDHPARRGRLPAGAGVGAAERGLQPAAAKAGKAGAHYRPHLFYDREPCYRGERARLLAGKGLSGGGVSGFPQGSCKTAPVWGIV